MLLVSTRPALICFFFPASASSEIYTLSLHDALPISPSRRRRRPTSAGSLRSPSASPRTVDDSRSRAPSRAPRDRKRHTSELQSLTNLVCRLLLETKKCTPALALSPRLLLRGHGC